MSTRRPIKWLPGAVAAALALLPILLGGCAGGIRKTSRSFTTVVIDAGHGGHDLGAHKNGVIEKQVCMDVALRLEKKLRKAGFHTVMTRRTDRFIPLDERVAISNRHRPAAFVSVHFNYSRNRAAHGVETFYHHPDSEPLARIIGDELGSVAVFRSMRRANFRVLKNNRNPAVLVECAYLSNKADAARAKNPRYCEAIAAGIARALAETRFGPTAAAAIEED